MLDTTAKLDMVTDGTDPDSDAYRCRELFQAVIVRAVLDATGIGTTSCGGRPVHQQQADTWIRGNGRDFREVCGLAGMDPDFVHDAYVAGRIDGKNLVSQESARAARSRTITRRKVHQVAA